MADSMPEEEDKSVKSFGFFDFIEIYDNLLKQLSCAYSKFALCLGDVAESTMEHYKSILLATADQQFKCCRETPIFLRMFSKFHDQVSVESQAYEEMSSYITSTSVVALTKLASEKKQASTICMTISDLQQVLSHSIDHFLAVQDEFFQLPDIEGSCTKILEMNKLQPVECEPSLVHHLHLHNNYVLELCRIDAMLDAFNNDIIPQITQKMNRNHRSALSRFYSILNAQSCFLTQKSCEVQGSRQMVQTSVTRLLRWNHKREDQIHVCECMALPTHPCSPLRRRSLEIYIPPSISCFSRIVTHHILANICSNL